MIQDLDEVLRKLLIRELPIKNGDAHIAFEQPRREWSGKLSRPTLNLFLYDIRENSTLRQNEWQITRNANGTATKQRSPARMDLHYMITAWANDVDDEHSLISRTVLALLRFPTLPEDLLTERLRSQPMPIPLHFAQQDTLRNPADIWGAIDNELRPAIACVITLAFNPFQPITDDKLVKTRDLRFRQTVEDAPADRFWMVGGTLRGAGPLDKAHMTLNERGQDVPIAPNGDFIIGNLEKGEYSLTVYAEGRKPQERKFTVPAPKDESYDIELEGGGAEPVTHQPA